MGTKSILDARFSHLDIEPADFGEQFGPELTAEGLSRAVEPQAITTFHKFLD